MSDGPAAGAAFGTDGLAHGDIVPGGEPTSVFRRFMELPRYLRVVHGEQALWSTLAETCGELGFERVAVACGPTATRAHAERLCAALDAVVTPPLIVTGNGDEDVEQLAAAEAITAADAVLAMGGGRTIDVAKSACVIAGKPVVVVPTQLTADGIASPVSVIRSRAGLFQSRHARLPIAVAVDLELIEHAPAERARAGAGDLLANPCALHDWRRAATAGREREVDDFAALLAAVAADLVQATDLSGLDRGTPSPELLERLLSGLVLSGLAMEIAGSSRPCSGSEHLISHALDQRHPGTATHGEQVAFGTLVCTFLQGQDWERARACMQMAGMDQALQGFGLSAGDLAATIRAAPDTRPGRYTVLDEVDLSDRALRPVLSRVLTHPAP